MDWIYKRKSERFNVFKILYKRFKIILNLKVRSRSDHGREGENIMFTYFCENKDILQEFYLPKTPQQNEIVERKNITLKEMFRVVLTSKNLVKRFWTEVLNTTCHISNKVYLRSGSNQTQYEILDNRKPNVKYFHMFGCVCDI